MTSILCINDLKKYIEAGNNPEYIFFWGHQTHKSFIGKECLSQWYPCNFSFNDINFNSAEQFMMAEKALLFQDKETYLKIISQRDMNRIKQLGREVQNFDQQMWDRKKFDIVFSGNMEKFNQNQDLKNYLISTQDKILVEASPYDQIWGIGKKASDENITDYQSWNGLNLLGFALMKVRNKIING